MRRVAKFAIWLVFGLLLFVAGVLMLLYNPGNQEILREKVVEMLNRQPGMEVSVDSLSLRFPLRLSIAGLTMKQDGDTLVAARKLDADVALLPLLGGEVRISDARLCGGFYRMGTPDSAMYLTIRAGDVHLAPAAVRLSPMDIHVKDGSLADAAVDMTLRSDTTAADTTVTPPSPLTIRLDRLSVANLRYNMRMLPTIDSLGATIGQAVLTDGKIDLIAQTVDLGTFAGSGLDAAYIAPDAATIAATPVAPPSTTTSKPWTVQIDSIAFTGSRGLYTTRGVVPQPGLDFAYIQADSMDLTVRNFYNQATTLSLPIRLAATERCGVRLDATGTFAMDSAAMYFRDFAITTPLGTSVTADGSLGVGDMLTDPSLPMRLAADGSFAPADLRLMFPAVQPYLVGMRASDGVRLNANLSGSPARLDVENIDLGINGSVKLRAHGVLTDLFGASGPGGDLTLSGSIIDVRSLMASVLGQNSGITVPPMSLSGHITANRGHYRGKLSAHTGQGKLALDADFNANSDGYDLALYTDAFPISAFMPALGVGTVTADISAKGTGLDLFSAKTTANADAHIASLVYGGYDYRDITLTAALADGDATVDAESNSADARMTLRAGGNLAGDTYRWTAAVDGSHIDLHALGFMAEPAVLTVTLDGDADITPASNDIAAHVRIPSLDLVRETGEINISDVDARFAASDSTTTLDIHNRDLTAHAFAPCGLDSLTTRFAAASEVIGRQIADRKVNIAELQHALPMFAIDITAGADNLINDVLAEQRMSISHFILHADNDSVLALRSQIRRLDMESAVLDTITITASQRGERLHLLAQLDNKPGNLDDWAHISADAMLNTDRLGLRVTQQNRAMKTGFDIGAVTVFEDSMLRARFYPLNPIIGYKNWTVNIDNYINYNFATHHIDANLHMQGDDSSLALYTEHPAGEEHDGRQEDIVLQIGDIHIADWVKINPFAPPISGDLSADMHINWDGGENVNGSGTLSLTDFFYDRQRVASLVADMTVSTNTSGLIRAGVDLTVDGRKTMTLSGALNDSTAMSPFNLDFSMIRFPLATVNPFLPADMARLSGVLNGNMEIHGDAAHPIINGTLDFDSTAVRVPMMGASFAFSDVKIPVVDNLVTFNGFTITGANDNPLRINGTVDIASVSDPKIDLRLNADNMMLVNTSRAPRGADIFGKAYASLDASVRGNMRFLSVNAKASLLAGTNVTYVLSATPNEIASQQSTEGMVKFVNFSDTAAVARADSISDMGMLLMIDALLTIDPATTINVDLNTNGRDKVVVMSEGTLNYTQTPSSDGRLTGRININSGMARYTLPVVGSEKEFSFNEGSYVAFTGDMLNPILNIHATDVVKANVTQSGQNSRLVNFDVLVGITGSLAQMDVKFDLSTNDDLTVANELQAMSAEQRANQAMNLLLYNMYTGPGTKADANMATNPLFSFLESQINSWAAQNIKGVDLTFGIDQYNQTTNGSTSSTMSYSYQVSKSLFDNRFKIVVGGNYSTDANADENFSQNLINDISFEYYLNRQQTMLVRLFRHTGFESILEGEVTKTGVGFVYKRRYSRLEELLPRFLRPHYKKPAATAKKQETQDTTE